MDWLGGPWASSRKVPSRLALFLSSTTENLCSMAPFLMSWSTVLGVGVGAVAMMMLGWRGGEGSRNGKEARRSEARNGTGGLSSSSSLSAACSCACKGRVEMSVSDLQSAFLFCQ